jgi:hypothetical protein
MVLEWIRRQDPTVDEQLRKYLFTNTEIVQQEEANRNSVPARPSPAPTIGSLKSIKASDRGGRL